MKLIKISRVIEVIKFQKLHFNRGDGLVQLPGDSKNTVFLNELLNNNNSFNVRNLICF